MKQTVILRMDGYDRHYPCDNYYDAIVLCAGLSKAYKNAIIEVWEGSKLMLREGAAPKETPEEKVQRQAASRARLQNSNIDPMDI